MRALLEVNSMWKDSFFEGGLSSTQEVQIKIGYAGPNKARTSKGDRFKLLDLSEWTVWGMANSGRIPKPIRIGRAVRWSYEELRAWVNAGCPPQDEWEWRWQESAAFTEKQITLAAHHRCCCPVHRHLPNHCWLHLRRLIPVPRQMEEIARAFATHDGPARLGWEPLFRLEMPFLYFSVWAFLSATTVIVIGSFLTAPDSAESQAFVISRRRRKIDS